MRHSRKLRDGAYYHVLARVNNKELLMEKADAKRLFENVLFRAKQKYSFSLVNFMIMGNHYHLMIKPGRGESLSCIMQWIMSVYAMLYNRKNGRSGHFWGERFFSRIIDSLRQFLVIFFYIDENPVRAGLVRCKNEWEFGGLWHHRTGQKHLVSDIPFWVQFQNASHTQLMLPFFGMPEKSLSLTEELEYLPI